MPESVQNIIHELTSAGLLSSAEVTTFNDEINVGVDALLDRLVADERITRYQADKFKAGQSSDIYFGDYIVMEELGRGGMGTVLLARHRRMDREVAIKVLPTTTMESEDAVARFFQEVKVAAKLTHPNIVHSYDAGEHHGIHYLVMEHVKGHDLARVLQHMGPVPVSLALDYVLQTARGLEYAHRKGIVHRDIKPSNLLLDDEGVVKILDMGLARLGSSVGGTEASMHLTTTGQVMGTVEYMSPEQAEDTRVADARSDIYSLGCTLYRLVTGTAPFARDTVVRTILAHREASIPALGTAKHPEFSKLDPLFRRMVAKNPDDRIQTATLLVQELRRLIESTDWENTELVTEADIEVVHYGSSEYPTAQHGKADSDGIEYVSEVQQPPPGMVVAPSGSNVASLSNLSGTHNDQPTAELPNATPLSIDPKLVRGKPHRGPMILGMGIASMLLVIPCFVGAILGIITWVYAQTDLREMKQGIRDPTGQTLTNAGRVLAIISCIIGAVYLIV